MKTIPLVLAVIAAIAAAAFGWHAHQALGEAQLALAEAGAKLEKAQGDLRSLKAEVEPLRKEAAEAKTTLEQQRAELSAAKAFLEAERTTTLRVREELALAKEQIAFISKSRAAQSSQQNFGAPTMIRPAPPMTIRALPAPAPQGAAVRAQ